MRTAINKKKNSSICRMRFFLLSGWRISGGRFEPSRFLARLVCFVGAHDTDFSRGGVGHFSYT